MEKQTMNQNKVIAPLLATKTKETQTMKRNTALTLLLAMFTLSLLFGVSNSAIADFTELYLDWNSDWDDNKTMTGDRPYGYSRITTLGYISDTQFDGSTALYLEFRLTGEIIKPRRTKTLRVDMKGKTVTSRSDTSQVPRFATLRHCTWTGAVVTGMIIRPRRTKTLRVDIQDKTVASRSDISGQRSLASGP